MQSTRWLYSAFPRDMNSIIYTMGNYLLLPIANLILGATVNGKADDKNMIESIFFQDQRMQKAFEVFPEVTFVDGTYKINDRDMTLYIMYVAGGNR